MNHGVHRSHATIHHSLALAATALASELAYGEGSRSGDHLVRHPS